MQHQDAFYIGYLPKAPKNMAGLLKIVIATIALLMIFVASMVVVNEEKFDESTFEYGRLTELKGVVSKHPVPMLKVAMGTNPEGQTVYRSFVLVNFGKMGAYELVDELAAKMDEPLDRYEVTVRGTLIYFDGKTLLELTNRSASFLGHSMRNSPGPVSNSVTIDEAASLEGEIIDPKCYFGVMKPGFGKVHRSCAVRCISGGIPPVLMMKNKTGSRTYVLLTDFDWQPVNRKILDKIGKGVRVSGSLQKVDDWHVLKLNEATPVALLNDPINLAKNTDALWAMRDNHKATTCPYHLESAINLCR
ncbi:MAG: hypothetical protein MI975_04090 [Cytophagales bacterium]|nr:hypothetical protein [Cytophagales bacterium]